MSNDPEFADLQRPHVLWIDDEMSSASAEVQLLELEGFRVHCATTATAGLAMARTRRYDGILLDLRLPDMPGLTVLASLRGEAITTPILILTGFGDFESAHLSGRLGANGYATKPLFFDDLVATVKRLLSAPLAVPVPITTETPELPAERQASLASLAALLEVLHRGSEKGVSDRDASSRTLSTALIRAMANAALPMPVFLACASALRSTVSDLNAAVAEQLLRIETAILDVLARPRPSDRRVIAAIEMLRSSAAERSRLKIEDIAQTQNTDPTYLGRLITSETGFDFTAWRTAYLLRPSVSALVDGNDGVKQIARGFLDYKHLSQFDHEFHRFFGLTPTQFRAVSRGQHD